MASAVPQSTGAHRQAVRQAVERQSVSFYMRRWRSARLWCGLAPKTVHTHMRPQRRALSSLGAGEGAACGYSGPMPAWRVPAGREQRADDVDVLVLGRRVQRGVGRGQLVEHVDPEEPTACRCWGLARRRSRRSPPVRSPPLPPRGSARRHRPRGSRGPETRRGWTARCRCSRSLKPGAYESSLKSVMPCDKHHGCDSNESRVAG